MPINNIVHNALRCDSTDVIDLRQFFYHSRGQSIKGTEVACQDLRGLLTHLPNTQAVDELCQIIGLGFFNGTDQVFSRFHLDSVQICIKNSLNCQVIKISNILNQMVFY